MLKLILVLLLSLLSLFNSEITSRCNISQVLDDKKYCFRAEQSEEGYWIEKVKKCDDDKICEGDGLLKTCKTPHREDLPPGEYCDKDEECHSKKCKKNLCKGKEEEDSCLETLDCDPGLYCSDSKKCKKQKDIGDKCSSDDECPTNSDCYNKKCTEVLTLEIGSITKNAYMCNTNYVAMDDTGTSRCASLESLDIPKKEKDKMKREDDQKLELFECKTDVDLCRYEVNMGENRKRIYTEPCQCSLKFPNRKFCRAGTDMPSFVFAKNLLKMAYWRTHFKAHRNARELRLNRDDKVIANKRYKFPKYAEVDDKIVRFYEGSSFVKFSLIGIIGVIMILI
ncbi:MAG: EB domain-containing protein [archaeon]|nr:EB domain-containing protein [archaeon]